MSVAINCIKHLAGISRKNLDTKIADSLAKSFKP